MFTVYPYALLISGALLIIVGLAVPRLSTGYRALNLLFGLGFLGYGIYLKFLFSGGEYIVFYYAFILPFFLIVMSIRAMAEGRKSAAAPGPPFPAGAPPQGGYQPGGAPYPGGPQYPPPGQPQYPPPAQPQYPPASQQYPPRYPPAQPQYPPQQPQYPPQQPGGYPQQQSPGNYPPPQQPGGYPPYSGRS